MESSPNQQSAYFFKLDQPLPLHPQNPKRTARVNLFIGSSIEKEVQAALQQAVQARSNGGSASSSSDALDVISRFPGIKRKYFKPKSVGGVRYCGLSGLPLPPPPIEGPVLVVEEKPLEIKPLSEQQMVQAFSLKPGSFDRKQMKEKKRSIQSGGPATATAGSRQLTPVSSSQPSTARTGGTPKNATPK